MNELFLIPPKLLPEVMDQVFPMIDAATKYSVGKYVGADVVKLLVNGSMQIWSSFKEQKVQAIALTEIAVYPQVRVLRFLCATGNDMEEWLPHLPEIEKWGRDQGCTSFQAECRPGWEKHLKHFGYSKTHVILSKELE